MNMSATRLHTLEQKKVTYGDALKEGNHALAEESVRVAHVKQLAILGLGEDPEIYSGNVLVASIDNRRTILHKAEAGEFLERLLAELVADLVLSELALFFNVKTAKVDVVLGLPASESGNTVIGC